MKCGTIKNGTKHEPAPCMASVRMRSPAVRDMSVRMDDHIAVGVLDTADDTRHPPFRKHLNNSVE